MLVALACAPTLTLDGVIEYVHPSDCVTVMVRPATMSVPDRPGPSLAVTRKTTTAEPLPLPPLVTVIHVA
jgi:hypothetical protein